MTSPAQDAKTFAVRVRQKVVNGTYYSWDTPDDLIKVLETLRTGPHQPAHERVRIFYGDPLTGRDWLEEWGMSGRISRSMGPQKIPILLCNRRSTGGGAILTGSIVRIVTTKGKRELYRHSKYHTPVLMIGQAQDAGYAEAVYADAELHAQFAKPGQAARWIRKMI